MSVYFVTCREIGRVKIGHAIRAKQRFHQLQTHSPLQLELEAVLEGGEGEERDLHHRFAAHRIKGEWFALCPEIEALIADVRPEPVDPLSIENPVARLLTTFRISQYDLADRMGVTQATVSRLVTGKIPVSRRTAFAVDAVEQALLAERDAA